MKRYLLLTLLLTVALPLLCQAPQSISYHAIVRNNSGNPMVNHAVSFHFSILKGSTTGSLIYDEQHDTITDQTGGVWLVIGKGIVQSGDFTAIDWGTDSYFLNIGIDTTGGTFYTDMGTFQFLSVPYALYSNKAGNGFSGNYNDLINKPITDGSETKINAGINIILSGTGTNSDPYIINSETKVTAGNNVIVTGSGTKNDPFIINERIHFVGESWGDGIVFYVYDNGRHGLIAAMTDQDPSIQWYNGTKRYTNTTGDGIGSGEMNTTLIIALQTNDNPMSNFAAKVCADYSFTSDGITYGDWYLPSKYELAILFIQKSTVGNFVGENYWSSTEFSSITAWCQNFSTGVQINVDKSLPQRVRAIRAF